MLPPLLFEGSVKNVHGVQGQSPYFFEYTDSYSVFDWGKMPDTIEGKGQALAMMGDFFFTFLQNTATWNKWTPKSQFADSDTFAKLCQNGLPHHSLGLLKGSPNILKVSPVAVIHPEYLVQGGELRWDYSHYQRRPSNCLVPLEVIFRFAVPEGSSLLSRAQNLEYCQELGLKESPRMGDRFEVPVLEFSSKLETSDRYVCYQEAQTMAGLTEGEFRGLCQLTSLIALRLKDFFNSLDIDLLDGKFEFAFDQQRNFMLVDSIGPDELRLISSGKQLSKESLRKIYRDSAWYQALSRAKKLASERGMNDWKEICVAELGQTPAPLPPGVKENISMMYQALANAVIGKEIFKIDKNLQQLVAIL